MTRQQRNRIAAVWLREYFNALVAGRPFSLALKWQRTDAHPTQAPLF